MSDEQGEFEVDTDDELDTEEFDDTEDSDEDTVISDSYDEDDEEDELAWVREAGPDKVKKTWNQYTQTREEVLQMERELEPFKKLKDEILADPGLVEVIDNYYKNGRPVDRELADVKQEMIGLRNQIATERELADTQDWIKKNEYPAVKDEAVLKYAVENGIPNLKAAYKDMMFDKIQDRKANQVVAGIKKSKGASSPTSKKPTTSTAKVTKDDLYKMSDEDFIKNYDKVMEQYNK